MIKKTQILKKNLIVLIRFLGNFIHEFLQKAMKPKTSFTRNQFFYMD